MKHTFTIDSDMGSVYHAVDGAACKTMQLENFLGRFSPKTLNLGLLPPVVKFITPIYYKNGYPYMTVVIEQTPCKRQIFFQEEPEWIDDDDSNSGDAYNLTLPWHSFYLTFAVTDDILAIQNVSLYFHEREIQSEIDLNTEFLCIPYLPNSYTHIYSDLFSRSNDSNLCIILGNEFESTKFSEFWESFMNDYWGSAFNDELGEPAELYYNKWFAPKRYDDDYCVTQREVFEAASEFSFKDACSKLISTEAAGNVVPPSNGKTGYLLKSGGLNPAFTLSQLLSGVTNVT